MKLHKKISVSGTTYPIIDGNQRLNLFTPGRALFTVEAGQALKGVVIFSCGYDVDSVNPWFVGYVEACTTVDAKQQKLFCRELSAALYYRLPLSLRNVDLKQALDSISDATSLQFSLPDTGQDYLGTRAAAFYNTGNGFHAMDSLGEVFGIQKPIWQQQVDGKVFVGSWDDSRWADKPVELNRNWERQLTSHDGATLPALPALRPGVQYNGNILTGVELTGAQMNITWSKNPWAER